MINSWSALFAAAAMTAFAATAALKLLIDGWPLLLSAPIAAAFAVGVYTVVAYRRNVAEAHLLLQPARRIIWKRRDQSG